MCGIVYVVKQCVHSFQIERKFHFSFILSATASMLPGIFLVAASYAECNEKQVVIYFVLAYAFDEFNIAGTWPNVLDLAPNYVGSITGLSNTFQIISSIIAHYIVGVLTPNVSVQCTVYYIKISRILLL